MKRFQNFKYHVVSILLLLSATVITDSFAGDKKGKEMSIPAKARTFVTQYLPGEKIVKSKGDGDGCKIECSGGTEIEFDRDGLWHEIKNGKHGIPASALKVLPNAALLYLQNNYNDVAVKKIEKRFDGYGVKLDTTPEECEIVFAKEGNVKKIIHDD